MTIIRTLLLCSISFTALQAQTAPGHAARAATVSNTAPQDCDRRIAEDFVPLTRTERAAQYYKSLVGLHAIVFSVVSAGYNQGVQSPDDWPQDARHFGYRVASSFGEHAVSTSFEHGLALWRGEDNRFFASGEVGVGRRLKYAISSAFLARHDNGTRSISISALGGPAAGSFISRLWLPDSSRSAGDAAVSFGISIAIRVGEDVGREFAPRFIRRFLP